MQPLLKRLGRLGWTLTLAVVIALSFSGKAQAQFPAYGMGYGFPGMGYGFPGMGYGFPGMGFGYGGWGGWYPGWGFSYTPYPYYEPGYTLPALGAGYPGLGYGYAFPGTGLGMGYLNLYGSGYYSPLFGVGLTPLGTQSYLFETQLLGRTPRVSRGYYGSAPRPYGSPGR
jgi:hypothetical protein